MTQDITEEFEPLGIKCTDTDCENGLHCFRQKEKLRAAGREGRCRACGVELIDWERLRSHDLEDVEFVFASLRYELIRHAFWHTNIDPKAINHARRKGRRGMREAAEKRLRKYVGPENPSFDGRQTPKSGNIIFYAQHATAACCRACVEQWHGFPKGRDLTDDEIAYLTELVFRYIVERLPDLTEEGEKVQPISRRRASGEER